MPDTTTEIDVLERWHEDEERWWDANGSYMTFQWQLTPRMSCAVRSELEADYKHYLFRSGGSLLDIGCGSGWLAAYFAERGMCVRGLDISTEQIAAAVSMAEHRNLVNADFEVADFLRWDSTNYIAAFDSVFVSAFLHHLPEAELRQTLHKIACVVKPGGRVFLYEPLQARCSRPLVVKIIDRFYNLFLKLLVDILPRKLDWWSDRHKAELIRGYTMNSPHEAPIYLDVLTQACSTDFELIETRGWHLNSLGFGMQSMGLKDSVRRFYEPLVAFGYKLDRFLLGIMGWQSFSIPGRFILCSVKLVRR